MNTVYIPNLTKVTLAIGDWVSIREDGIQWVICIGNRAVFTWLSKGIGFGFGFGFGFTTPFGWLVYSLWFWFYDSQVTTALYNQRA